MTALREKFKTIQDLVWVCLNRFPETRGNDRELIKKVWELQGFRIPKKLLALYYRVASPETVRRCRQMIQNQGLFLADSETTAKRSLFAMEQREMFRSLKKEKND